MTDQQMKQLRADSDYLHGQIAAHETAACLILPKLNPSCTLYWRTEDGEYDQVTINYRMFCHPRTGVPNIPFLSVQIQALCDKSAINDVFIGCIYMCESATLEAHEVEGLTHEEMKEIDLRKDPRASSSLLLILNTPTLAMTRWSPITVIDGKHKIGATEKYECTRDEAIQRGYYLLP